MNYISNDTIDGLKKQGFAFSFFKSLRGSGNPQNTNLQDFANAVKSEKYKGVVDILRDLYSPNSDNKDYKKQKAKLPIITPAGLFKERKKTGIEKPSGIIVLDVDGLTFTELSETRRILTSDKHVICVFVSPSGAGLKAFVMVDVVNDKECKLAFNEISEHFKKEYNITLDKSGKDISRACFVSYDPDIYLSLDGKCKFDYCKTEKTENETGEREETNTSAVARMKKYVENTPGTTSGSRNHEAYLLACKCLIDFDCSMEETTEALSAWNNRNNPPMDQKRLALTCKNAQKYGSGVRGCKNKSIELETDGMRPKDKNGKEIHKLAELPILEYEILRLERAKKIGIKPARLDKLVDDARKTIEKIKNAEPKRNSVAAMLAEYYEVRHTLDYWSVETSSRVPMGAVRKSNPSCFGLYDKHPQRKSIKASDIVFKPEGGLTGNQVNTFTGLNVTPDERTPTKILDLLFSLCNEQDELYSYVLKWLALPLQKLGTKMDTALVFTSVQGTGKSLFFDKCYGEIYKGWYAKIKQIELEGRFNGWEAQKLFLFADEIEARHGQNDVANHIKTRITSDTVIIEKKGVDQYEENARANFVFCSNDITPVKIEKGDRRFTSIRSHIKREKEFYNEVAEEVKDNGAGRLYTYLMSYDITGFNANSQPYETEEKDDQVRVFLSSHEEFIDKWIDGDPDIRLKFGLVKAKTLYEAYRSYCDDNGHTFPVTMTKLALLIKRDYHSMLKKERRGDGNYYNPYFS